MGSSCHKMAANRLQPTSVDIFFRILDFLTNIKINVILFYARKCHDITICIFHLVITNKIEGLPPHS